MHPGTKPKCWAGDVFAGPGQYSVLQPSGGPAFTMRGRPAECSDPAEGQPGPGDYEQPQSELQAGPAFSFTGRGGERETVRPPSPGPGEWVGQHGTEGSSK